MQTYAAPSAPYYTEKKEATEEIRRIPEYYETEGEPVAVTHPDTTSWNPGFISRFPWLGLGSLLLVLLCLGGNVAILTLSNGRAQGDQTWKQIYRDGLTKGRWPKQIRPSVLLTVLNSVANLAFSLAIANGVAIAWWRKALKGSTIQSLHKSWNFSSSIKAAALSAITLKGFNGIALTALIAKCTIIDGILMQSASVTGIAADRPTLKHNITTWANTSIPNTAYKGVTSGNLQIASFLADDVFMWKQSPRTLPYTGFAGCENATCYAEVPGAGFEFDCSEPTQTSTNWSQSLKPQQITFANQSGTVIERPGTSIFDITFRTQWSQWLNEADTGDASAATSAALIMDVLYSQASDVGNLTLPDGSTGEGNDYAGCPGTMYNQSCVLRPAIIGYPVMAQAYGGPRSTRNILLTTQKANAEYRAPQFDRSAKQQEGFKIVGLSNVFENPSGLFETSQLYGLMKTFETLFAGQANLTCTYKNGCELTTSGNAVEYISAAPTDHNYCGYMMNDPVSPDTSKRNMQSLVAMINEIMFMISTDASGTDPAAQHQNSTVPATMYTESVHYHTRFLYMMGAIISTVVCVACVLPTYWGYWQLGRKVSLGPFEIAHAFRSPMTAQAATGDIEQVMERVGHQQVQYGQIVAGDARGVMGVAEPEYVAGLQTSAKQELREKFLRRGVTQ